MVIHLRIGADPIPHVEYLDEQNRNDHAEPQAPELHRYVRADACAATSMPIVTAPASLESKFPTKRETDTGVVGLLVVGRRPVEAFKAIHAPVKVFQKFVLPGRLQLDADTRAAAHVEIRDDRVGDLEVLMTGREEVQLAASCGLERLVDRLIAELLVRVGEAGERRPEAPAGVDEIASES